MDHATIGAWGAEAAALGRAIVEGTVPGAAPRAHQAVITSGPPHMIHDGGRRVAETTGLPFVMDMRDPWSATEHVLHEHASPLWFRLAARHERRAIRRAALVTANTEIAERELHAIYPDRAADIITVMNGADDDPLPPPKRQPRFTIAHAGTVYFGRNPRPLFQAAARVIGALGLTPDDLHMAFIGAGSSFPLLDVARQEGVEAFVSSGPSLPHQQALDFMAGATVSLVMSGTNRIAIPAKLFECARFEAWLLLLSTPNSATALAVRGTDADVVDPDDVDGLARVLQARYEQHRAGVVPPVINADGQFSRRTQAARLFDALQARLPARVLA